MKLITSLAVLFAAANAAKQFHALSYNPKQLDNGSCPTVDTVRKDLKTLSPYTDELRIYSVQDCNQGEPVLRAMEGTNWKIQLGLWINNNDTVYEIDRDELIRLTKYFDFKKHVTAVIVGNEAIYREEQTSEQVAEKVKDTKAALAKVGLKSIPVTVSETWPSYDKTLIDAVDYVNMHAFPYWEGINVKDAQSRIFKHIYDIQKIAGNKKVVVGETGWPDGGGNYESAEPTKESMHLYMREFICRANMEKIDYVWFSAFDEAWKPTTNASDVETHWGIIQGNRKPKFDSPMYDCKGFVPSSKEDDGDKDSSDNGSESESDDRSSDSEHSSRHHGNNSSDDGDNDNDNDDDSSDNSEESGSKSIDSDESSISEGVDEVDDNSGVWSLILSGSSISAVTSAAMLAAFSFF